MTDYFDSIKVKDQLGSPSDTGIFVIGKNETVLIDEQPTVIQNVDLGDHFTLDHPTNGILDSATLELDTGLGTQTSHYIVSNKDNIFRWYFRFTQGSASNTTYGQLDTTGFTDAANTTATEDVTTDYAVEFATGEVWTSLSLYKDPTSTNKVTAVKVSATGSLSSLVEVSSNGGSNWYETELDTRTPITATAQGYDLRVRITATASGFPTMFGTWGSGGSMTYLWVEYELS